MSRQTRSIENPPDYYHGLTGKQQRNWRRNARKIEHNEELRRRHPPFEATLTATVIHIHHRTEIAVVEELITAAKITETYSSSRRRSGTNSIHLAGGGINRGAHRNRLSARFKFNVIQEN